MALVEALKYLVTADTTNAVSEFQKLDRATKTLTELEAKQKRLAADKSEAGIAKFAQQGPALSRAITKARGDLDLLNASTGKTASGFDKLKGAFASGLGIGSGIAAAQTLVAGLQKLATVAVDEIGRAVGAASTLEQAAGSTRAIFGSASSEVQKFGRDAADSVGLSNAAFQQQTAVIGALLQNLGFTQKAAADLSIELVKSGADLGATFGRSTADAVIGIGALLRGEYDTIEKFGVKVKQADIDSRVLSLGLDTSTQALKNNAQATAALAIFREQASRSAGTFAEKENTLLGQQQRLNAEWENARAALGQSLLPLMTDLARIARDAVDEVDAVSIAFRDMASDVRTVATLLPSLYTGLLNIANLGSGGDGIFGKLAASARNAVLTVPGLGPTILYVSEKMKEAREEAERMDNIGKAFGRLADGVREGTTALEAYVPALGFLPPALREAAYEMLGLKAATDPAAESLKKLNEATSNLSSIGDRLFGVDKARDALQKATRGGTDNAKQYEQALRQVENAQRSLEDAQRGLNETLFDRFLVGLGATSDEVTSAQIAERDSTRALAESKLRLIDAEQELQRLRNGGQATDRLEAQAALLEANKALEEAKNAEDPVALARARAAVARANEGLVRTSSAAQATQLARAETAVEEAKDGVTKAAIDQRNAQRDLNDTMMRGKEGSKELADANRAVEDAQRRVEDATRSLDDAQDGLVSGLKDSESQFYKTLDAADALIKQLIDKKASPQEFASAVDEINAALGKVAGPEDLARLQAYNAELDKTLQKYTQEGGFGSKIASAVMPKGTQANSSANAAEFRLNQTLNVNLDGNQILSSLVDANAKNGYPFVTTVGR